MGLGVMSYCTPQDLIDRFGEQELIQLTDLNRTRQIGQVVLNQAMVDADSEIDSFLRLRYSLPLLTIPTELIAIACDITRYRLMREGATEAVAKRYELAVSFLKNLSSGKAVLPREVNAQSTSSENQLCAPKLSASQMLFSDQFLSRL
jgi:phage gp36-like protein